MAERSFLSAAGKNKDYNHGDDNNYKYFTLTEKYCQHRNFVP